MPFSHPTLVWSSFLCFLVCDNDSSLWDKGRKLKHVAVGFLLTRSKSLFSSTFLFLMEWISRMINVTVNLLWKEIVSLMFCFSSSCLFGWLFVAVLPRMETSNLVASSASFRCGSTVPVNTMESFWSLIYSNMIMSGQVSEALQFGCKRVKSLPCKMPRSCTASNNNCRPTWTFPGNLHIWL